MSIVAMFSEEEGETEWKVEREDENGCIDNCLWMSQKTWECILVALLTTIFPSNVLEQQTCRYTCYDRLTKTVHHSRHGTSNKL